MSPLRSTVTPAAVGFLVLLPIHMGCARGPDEYFYHRSSRPIFFADFDTSTPEFWIGNDGQQEGQLERGDYRFRSLTPEPRFNAPPFPVDVAGDFEVEAAVAGSPDAPDKRYGVVLGELSGPDDFLFFEVTRGGKYVITQNHVLLEGELPATSQRAYRKLTIRKVGSQLFFFVNEKYLYSYPMPKITTFRAGVSAGEAGVVWSDYFRVSQYQ